jgi:hypothetical protein
MPEARFARARHARVAAALGALDGTFLADCQCWFGGGTRIVLELGEYRESEDVDFLCGSAPGYRALRSAIDDRSLGKLAARPVALLRDVRADRYGIRTVLDVNGAPLKFEIVLEGRIELGGMRCAGLPVPCLDHASCFAEKLLANADRGRDDAVLGRDAIDLAFMVEAWSPADARTGAERARRAYGAVVDGAMRAAAQRLLDAEDHRKRCVAALRVVHVKTMLQGLRKLARGELGGTPQRRARLR